MKKIEDIRDEFCYIVQSAYLKFPHTFRRKYGITTHHKVDTNFPNPKVGIEDDGEIVQITYEFNVRELREWKESRKLNAKEE